MRYTLQIMKHHMCIVCKIALLFKKMKKMLDIDKKIEYYTDSNMRELSC